MASMAGTASPVVALKKYHSRLCVSNFDIVHLCFAWGSCEPCPSCPLDSAMLPGARASVHRAGRLQLPKALRAAVVACLSIRLGAGEAENSGQNGATMPPTNVSPRSLIFYYAFTTVPAGSLDRWTSNRPAACSLAVYSIDM